MNDQLTPEGMTVEASEGTQQPAGAKDVSPGVNQAAGTPPAVLAQVGNGSDQEGNPGLDVQPTLSPEQAAKRRREEKAARKWAAVLAFPCASKACLNLAGQPCTFADGRVRQKPHDQRIEAAREAGAYVEGQRVAAVVVG